MSGWGSSHYRPKVDPSTIMFSRKVQQNPFSFNFSKNQESSKEESHQKLFLLSKFIDFPIFEVIPKNFSISTKDGTSYFNIDMLSEVSPVISKYIQDNPNEMHYYLNINDEDNVLGKFEQLFLGKTVFFDEDETPSSQRITKMLQIKNCPNYLKPESLRISEFFSNGNRANSWSNVDIKSGVVIFDEMFVEYLKSDTLQKFTIKTAKREYKCNVFGIYSSDVIRQILEQDPAKQEFNYNCEDEDDEFQLICDLFNFKEIDIKSDNMNFLKEVADHLKINCIIKQLDDYINNYEKFSEKVDEQQTIIESIDNLFDLLYNIKTQGIGEVKLSITQSKWVQTYENIQELAAFILQVVKPNFALQNEMADLLIELSKEANESNKLDSLIPFIVERLFCFYFSKNLQKDSFGSVDKSINSNSSFGWGRKPIVHTTFDQDDRFIYSFIRLLYNKGLISKEEIVKNLENYKFENKLLNFFFFPELIEINPNNYNSIVRKFDSLYDERYLSIINHYWPDRIDLYKRMIDNFEVDDELTKSLRIDDVDTLQLIITRNEIDISKAVVPFNIFDNFVENPTFINYACLYGSLKCFKYLLLNDGQIDESTTYFAVYGGNIEIIKIVYQRIPEEINKKDDDNEPKNNFGYTSYYNDNRNNDSDKIVKTIEGKLVSLTNHNSDNIIISSTIIMHRNDLFDWIFENRFVSKGKIGNSLNYLALLSAKNGNAHSLIEIIDKGFDITSSNAVFDSARNGFYTLTQLLMSIMNQKTDNDKTNFNKIGDYYAAVQFNNLSIFKLFLKQMNSFFIQNAIVYAIKKNYRKIIEYSFDNIDSINLKNDDFITNSLNESFNLKTDELFNFLVTKFKILFPEAFNLKLYLNLINHACQSSNLSATKTITEKILKEEPKQDFSSAFIEASSSGSIDICEYFIEKKVYINYDRFSMNILQLGSIDDKLFKIIINNVNPSIKYEFYGCIYQAISNKNTKLIKFLLKEKVPMKDALFEAVYTHDIEIVNLILKYNSKPSFVNQKNSNGTALHIACENKDLTIVKRLLSIPGINAGLFNRQGKSVFSVAIKNYDIDIINAILDFYGDDFISQDIIIDDIFSELNMIISSNEYVDKRIIQIIKRFAQIKSINPNCISNSNTLLYKACSIENYDLVEALLEFDRIDVNMYDDDTYGTPLIVAVQKENVKLVELLINYPKTDINLRDSFDSSPLIIACSRNNKEIVNLVLKSEKFDPFESRLDFSFYLASIEIAKILASLDALDVNCIYTIECVREERFIMEDFGKTSLIKAVENNDIDKIDLILNHRTFDKVKSNINRAIFVAAKENNINVFKQLLKIINDDILINFNDQSLFVAAADNLSGNIIDDILKRPQFDPSNDEIFDAFASSYSSIKYKRNLHPLNQWGNQPPLRINSIQLHPNLIPDKLSVLEMMTKIYNYDKEKRNSIDLSMLLESGKSVFTCIEDDFDEIKQVSDFLIDKGADPNMPDKKGVFPLQHAIKIKSLGMVNSLIDSKRIDFNQLPNGNTYLHASAKVRSDSILKFFLDLNLFDINAVNNDGETPLIIASKYKVTSNIDLLFACDKLDYLHCDKNGNDALKIVGQLKPSEEREARQNKEAYHMKLISVIKENEKARSKFNWGNNL